MYRTLLLSLAMLVASPAATALAASQPDPQRGTRLCVVVLGAHADVSADELAAGIADGTMVITSVRPCAEPPREGPDEDAPDPDVTAGPPAKGTGQWVVNPIEQDPLTDDPITSTWVYADGSRSAALVVECVSRGITQVRIFWNLYLDLETAGITTRIADEEPVTQAWPLDETGTSSYYPTDPLAFLASLFGKDRLVAQTKPWNRNDTTLVFPITGVEDAVANVRTACGW